MKTQKLVASIVLVLLAGCGEETSPEQSNNILAPLVGDGFQILSQSEKQTTVSLSDLIIDPQGLPVTLESVESSDQGCEEPISINAKALSFTVTNTNPEMCFYHYVVKNHPEKASQSRVSEANSYVLKSAGNDATLPPLSETTQVDNEVIVSIPAISGYTLDDDVTVLGDGSAFVELANQAGKDAGTVTYTPSTQGVTRLIYTMTSESKTDIKMGTIDISVSDTGNTPPKVEQVELETQPENKGYYEVNKIYTIDLKDYIPDTDADGDSVQLIQVKVWNASANLAKPDDPTSLSFTFKTPKSGSHYVTYVVSDHRGGYGVEQVRIDVFDLSSGATWGDINIGSKLFSAPLTLSEALNSGSDFLDSHVDSNGSTVATFDFNQAQKFCQDKGHLPTPENLKELSDFDGGPAKKQWPVDMAYWANDGGTSSLVNLATGADAIGSPKGNYVTCVNEFGIVVDTAASDFEAVANGTDEVTIVATLTLGGTPIQGEVVTASSDSMNVTFDSTNEITDDNGVVKFSLSSLKAERPIINVEYQGETLHEPVTFIADEATSSLSLEVTKDDANGNDPDGNEVEATMVDVNTNPLVGSTVTFESDAGNSVTITPAPGSTDAEGKQKASVVWSDGPLNADTTVNITARFTPLSTGTEITDTAAVTFVRKIIAPEICGGAVDDTDPANVKGNCLKVATDADGHWFSSTPSLAVMNALGYSQDPYFDNTGDTYESLSSESGGKKFAKFSQVGKHVVNPGESDDDNAGVNGQFDRWCEKLNKFGFGGRTNWRRPSEDELIGLKRDVGGSLWETRGWPSSVLYWSSTIDDSNFVGVSLDEDYTHTTVSYAGYYASCVSKT